MKMFFSYFLLEQDIYSMNTGLNHPFSFRECSNSPVEFEILLEKITIKQTNSLSYTKFSAEYENEPCQVVYFEEKKVIDIF